MARFCRLLYLRVRRRLWRHRWRLIAANLLIVVLNVGFLLFGDTGAAMGWFNSFCLLLMFLCLPWEWLPSFISVVFINIGFLSHVTPGAGSRGCMYLGLLGLVARLAVLPMHLLGRRLLPMVRDNARLTWVGVSMAVCLLALLTGVQGVVIVFGWSVLSFAYCAPRRGWRLRWPPEIL
jgi:hypothetical protein